MKVNIEIECTPVEARQFFGLPNVEPMQAAVMKQLEQRMLADIERFSPEALMKNWLAVGPQGAEQMRDFFRGIFWPPIMAGSRSIWPAGMPRAWVPMHRSSSR